MRVFKALLTVLLFSVIVFAFRHKAKTISLRSGLKYTAFKHTDSLSHPAINDIVYYHLILKNHLDSVVFDTHLEFGPQQLEVDTANFKGDLNEAFQLMSKGDSMCFYIKTDSLYGSFMPSFAQKKKYMKFYITLLDFMSKEKWKEKLTKDFNLQATIDDRILQEYFAQKNKRPNAIGKGLYYLIANKGNTKFPVAGDTIRVNYTGKLTSGKVFDSNTDPQFKHVESFEFVVGKGNVIKGWDEGLLYFDEHSKGTLYIPSGLAYGKRASGIIPVNGILIFDIELLAIHPAK